MNTITTFTMFFNYDTGNYDLHALQCSCNDTADDIGTVHTINATSATDAMNQIIATWASWGEDFNGSESGGADEFFKIFACTNNAHN